MQREQSNIMIVDDEIAYTILLRQTLLLEGYSNIHIANNGQDALQIATYNPLDLAIVDVKMRGMDGIETMYELQKLQAEITFVVVSGSAMSEEEYFYHARQIGVKASFSKPFDYNEFLGAIDQLLFAKQQMSAEKVSA